MHLGCCLLVGKNLHITHVYLRQITLFYSTHSLSTGLVASLYLEGGTEDIAQLSSKPIPTTCHLVYRCLLLISSKCFLTFLKDQYGPKKVYHFLLKI